MTDRAVAPSPRTYARIGGLLYLIIIVAGGFSEFSRGNLIVSGDATATANKIMAAETLFRISVAAELGMLVCAVALTLILYVLLGPVSKNLALLATFFNLVSIAIEGATRVNVFAALFPLSGAGYLKAFDPQQLQVLAYLPLKLYDYGFAASLVFFGCCLIVYGYLIFRSDFFPNFLGIFLILGGSYTCSTALRSSWLPNSKMSYSPPSYCRPVLRNYRFACG